MAYWEIRGRVGGNGFGAMPVSWQDIDAYCRLTAWQFSPWELRLITALDDLWLRIFASPTEEGQSGDSPAPITAKLP